MYIKNCRNSSKFRHYSPFKLHHKLKNMSFEVGNFSYCQPLCHIPHITKSRLISHDNVKVEMRNWVKIDKFEQNCKSLILNNKN